MDLLVIIHLGQTGPVTGSLGNKLDRNGALKFCFRLTENGVSLLQRTAQSEGRAEYINTYTEGDSRLPGLYTASTD